jgi:prolyl-tRNA editing enzyme YbaK/EbsC (Cys-tRNA(Pro) deacylase)
MRASCHDPRAVEALSGSAGRVQEALRAQGLDNAVREMPDSTRTAPEAAAALGCEVGHIAKSLVFRCERSGEPVLVIASGPDRVDEQRLAEVVGEPVGKADADFVRARTGFGIGGVPPLGHAEPIRTLIEERLLSFDPIWAAAGTPHHVFAVSPDDLRRVTGGEVVSVAA